MNDSEKFMRLFGLIFFLTGVLTFISGVITLCVSHDLFAGGIPIMLGIVFGVVGGGVLLVGIKKNKERKNVAANGTRYTGKIYGYVENRSYTMNGDFTVNIKVRYFDEMHVEREALLPTEFVKGNGDYPIGATIDFFVLGSSYSWDPKSVRYEKIEGEEELMDSKPIDPGKITMTAVSCPMCGASFSAAKGYVSKCPYCGGSVEC